MFQILPKTTAWGVVIEHSPSTCLLTQQATASESCTCDQAKCGRNIIYPCLLRDKKTNKQPLRCTSASFFFFLALCPETQPHPLKGCLFSQRDTHSWLVQTKHKRHKSNLFWLISWDKTFRGECMVGTEGCLVGRYCLMSWKILLIVYLPNSHSPPAFFID